MYIYLDDIRNPDLTKLPVTTVIVRTASEAIKLLRTGNVTGISFDHDLGEVLTGYDVAKEIERLVWLGIIDLPTWTVHSANPVGRSNIEQAMRSASRFNKRG